MNLIFVGERKSPTAKRRGWSWEDGRLAAKQLFDALATIGISPSECRFANAFSRGGIARVWTYARMGWVVVGMGQKAQGRLTKLGIRHLQLIHPAARGAIRRKDRYAAHVKEVLSDCLPKLEAQACEG